MPEVENTAIPKPAKIGTLSFKKPGATLETIAAAMEKDEIKTNLPEIPIITAEQLNGAATAMGVSAESIAASTGKAEDRSPKNRKQRRMAAKKDKAAIRKKKQLEKARSQRTFKGKPCYLCDVEKNVDCPKLFCKANPASEMPYCELTKDRRFAKDPTPIDATELLKRKMEYQQAVGKPNE